MSEEFLRKVKEILIPKLGTPIAESTIRVNCERLGIKPEELSYDKLDIFLEEIKISLLLFLEEKEMKEIIQKIKNLPRV